MYWNREIWKFLWWKKHAYESSSSYFNPESAIKNNRKDFLNQLRQFKFVTTLVSESKKKEKMMMQQNMPPFIPSKMPSKISNC